jgi:CBS domain containing-hemolysin-like protein
MAALIESALRYASLARLEGRLAGPEVKDRYAAYLEEARALSGFCLLARVAAATAMVSLIVLRARAEAQGVVLGVLAAVGLLVLAEWPARAIGRKWSDAVLRFVLPALYWAAWPVRLVTPAARRADGQEEEPEPEVVEAAKEEIRVAIEDGAVEGALEAEEKEMIEGIMKFRNVDVAEIMTPRMDMECLEEDLSVAEAARELARLHHSRIPVYRETLDSIVGIVYVKDVLAALGRQDAGRTTLEDVMREPLFVPETKAVGALLQQFQDEHVQIAVVLDEYGGVLGLLTVEDIMEEIVGEIQDEYDEEDHEGRIRRRSSGGLDVDARVRTDEVAELLGVDIPEDEDYDTIGGYVTARMARVPAPGEEFESDGLLVRVLQSDQRRVRRIFLKRKEPPAGPR